MTIPIYQVDAFAEAPFQGNPAAVCPLDEWLPDDLLQSIATENNLSETAYFVKTGDHYHLRWFTPVAEVDLCGHATLASAFVLFEFLKIDQDLVSFHTRSGPLLVSRQDDRIVMDFPSRSIEPCDTPAILSESLGLAPQECYRTDDYFAVFNNEDEIRSLQPDFSLLKNLETRGIIVTAPGDAVDFVSRFFAPRHNIDEDPVTGSAHCLLAPYWAKRLGRTTLRAQQLSQRTGHLECRLADDRVIISGKVRPYLQGTITIA